MTPAQSRKIKRLYQRSRQRTVQGQPRTYGPYWIGQWDQDGKSKHVWIGKKLPPSLKRLLQGKHKREGLKTYHWPRSRGYKPPTPQPAKA